MLTAAVVVAQALKRRIAIVDEIAWYRVEGKRFAKLLRGPRRRRVVGDRDMNDAPAFMREHDEDE